jgi:hypothetical protein
MPIAPQRLLRRRCTSRNLGFTYDTQGQLTGTSGNWLQDEDEENAITTSVSYSYDDNGNRLTGNGSSYTVATNNQITSDGTFTYTYDDEGNRSTKARISSASVDDKTAGERKGVG